MNERSRKHSNQGKREGEVTIDYNSPTNNKTRSQNEGEYIDFEEVE